MNFHDSTRAALEAVIGAETKEEAGLLLNIHGIPAKFCHKEDIFCVDHGDDHFVLVAWDGLVHVPCQGASSMRMIAYRDIPAVLAGESVGMPGNPRDFSRERLKEWGLC